MNALEFKHAAFLSGCFGGLLECTSRGRLCIAWPPRPGCRSARPCFLRIMPMKRLAEHERPHPPSGQLVGAEIAQNKISG